MSTESIPPRQIVNTTTDPITPYLVLLDGLDGGGGSRAIEAMEARGQQQLVNSDRLPTKGSDDPQLTELGFTFGEPDKDDPMFRPATLPAGWKRVSSDHNMWSYIVDELGRRRVAIFYKAAFYDRSAHMGVVSLTSYLRDCLWENVEPVLDDSWATRQSVLDELLRLAGDEDDKVAEYEGFVRDRRGDVDYWARRIPEIRAKATKIRQLAERINGGAS